MGGMMENKGKYYLDKEMEWERGFCKDKFCLYDDCIWFVFSFCLYC